MVSLLNSGCSGDGHPFCGKPVPELRGARGRGVSSPWQERRPWPSIVADDLPVLLHQSPHEFHPGTEKDLLLVRSIYDLRRQVLSSEMELFMHARSPLRAIRDIVYGACVRDPHARAAFTRLAAQLPNRDLPCHFLDRESLCRSLSCHFNDRLRRRTSPLRSPMDGSSGPRSRPPC